MKNYYKVTGDGRVEVDTETLLASPQARKMFQLAEEIVALQDEGRVREKERRRIIRAAVAWYEVDSAAVAADDELLELAKAVRAYRRRDGGGDE